MKNLVRAVGAVAGTVALVGSGSAAFADTVLAGEQSDRDAQVSSVDAGMRLDAPGAVALARVEGAFGFSQEVVTPNGVIASVFQKAAASFCSSAPDYVAEGEARAVSVGGSAAEKSYVGTVADMADEEESTSYVMACSCASNTAGGGAIANARVSGVSLASVAALAGVR